MSESTASRPYSVVVPNATAQAASMLVCAVTVAEV